MKCPNCGVGLSPEWGSGPLQIGRQGRAEPLTEQPGERWELRFYQCSECNRIAVYLFKGFGGPGAKQELLLLWPKRAVSEPLSAHAPNAIASEYAEAQTVFADSAKASAALSRRLLQRILNDVGGATQRDLADQIEAVLPSLPSHLQKSLDGIRSVGNFAAHPMKSKNAGAIFDVEPGEAEWSLSTLSDVIDFYYVRPKVEAERKAGLNRKLAEAGKPPMK